MTVKWFINAKTSEYTDKEGLSKNRYSTIGTIVETKKGDLMLMLETLPLFAMKEGKLMAFLNSPKDKEDVKPTDNKPTYGSLDDIPF